MKSIQALARPFSEAELIRLISALGEANLSESDLNVINHIMTNSSDTLDSVFK